MTTNFGDDDGGAHKRDRSDFDCDPAKIRLKLGHDPVGIRPQFDRNRVAIRSKSNRDRMTQALARVQTVAIARTMADDEGMDDT